MTLKILLGVFCLSGQSFLAVLITLICYIQVACSEMLINHFSSQGVSSSPDAVSTTLLISP